MRNKNKIFTSIAVFGSAIFAMVLTAGTGIFESLGLLGKNRATVDSYVFNLEDKTFDVGISSKNNKYDGSPKKMMFTETGGYANFAFSNCSQSPGNFVQINDGGTVKNVDIIHSISEVIPVFSAPEGASLRLRASYDGKNDNWADYVTLTSGSPYSLLASEPYFVEFSATGENIVVESIEIKFSCGINPNAEQSVGVPVYSASAFDPDASDYSGSYIFAYEAGGKVFDGSLDNLNQGNVETGVAINKTDKTIEYTDELGLQALEISKIVKRAEGDKYSVKTSKGYYIGSNTDNNAVCYDKNYVYENTFEYDNTYECYVLTSENGRTFAYNNNSSNGDVFRFYKNLSEYIVPVQFYKLTNKSGGGTGKPVYESSISVTDSHGTYRVQETFNSFTDKSDGMNVVLNLSDGSTKSLINSKYSYVIKDSNGNEVDKYLPFTVPGNYRVTITYGSLLPVSYNIVVDDIANSVTASKTTTKYAINSTLNYNDLTAVKFFTAGGNSGSIAYSNFASNGLATKLIDPNGNVVSNNMLNTVGDWTLRVYLLENENIKFDITIAVDTVKVDSITLDNSTADLNIGFTLTLNATVLPGNATDKTVTWTTSSSAIATVENGVVTGKAEGQATITAKAGNQTASCLVTVSSVPVSSISLPESISLYIGDEQKLNATITPDYATNLSVTWSVTSGSEYVSVSADGTVTALAEGTATVQVKSNDNENAVAACTVTVSKIGVSKVELNYTELTMYIGGGRSTLTATVSPDNATDKTVSWSISDGTVASISAATGDSVEVTAIKAGSTIITASAGGKSATCDVTVSAEAPKWTLVESESDLTIGNKYVIAENTNGKTAGNISNSIMGVIDSEFSSDLSRIDTLGTDTVQLTLGQTSDGYTFTNSSGDLLGATAVKKLTWGSGTTSWDISISNDAYHSATISNTNDSYGRFLFNKKDTRFTTYTSNTTVSMLLPQLYGQKAGASTDTPVETITISPSSKSLYIGDMTKLTATVSPATATNKALNWTTDDRNVATVGSDGTVTAVGLGTATITATAKDGSGVSGTATITVSAVPVTLESITVSGQKTEYSVGDSFVKPTVTATYSDGSNNNVTSLAVFEGFNSSSAGSRTINVSYTEDGTTVRTSFTITIKTSGSDVPTGDEYQITFRANGSDNSSNLTSVSIYDEITSGASYISSIASMDKLYQGVDGVKIGSSKSGGYLKFNVSSEISSNTAVSIKLDVTQYGSDVGDVNVYINDDESNAITCVDPSETSSSTGLVPDNTNIESIKVVSTKRAYLNGITISTKPLVPISPTSITVNPSTLTMTSGETSNLTVSYYSAEGTVNTNKGITWSSSDSNKVSVDSNGKVTAKANTSSPVTITATGYNNITSSCAVTVKDIAVTGVTMSPTSAEISIGSTKQLTATVSPSNATNQALTWSSDRTSVATVDSNGLVSAVATGNAVITATSQADGTKKATCNVTVTEEQRDKWTILMYVCGADLESESGLASGDFDEICKVTGQPDDVNIVIQTGGASSWDSYGISGSANQRYVVQNRNLTCVNNKVYNSYTSMGLSSTLADFVGWGMKEYPAEKTGLIFWNHGGGMRGVCYDEKKKDDALTNSELKSGISSGLSKAGLTGSKLEFVGFDACLMAVQDIAEFLSPYANYMVASEESEAGYGWDYDNWVDDLYAKKDTTVILKAICDSFIADNGGTNSTKNDQTLSFMNLNYAQGYLEAWEALAEQCSSKASGKGRDSVISQVGSKVKHYADSDYNYFHLFDAYDFVEKIATTYLGVSSTYTDAVKNYFNGSSLVSSSVNNNKFVCYTTCGKGAGNSHGVCCVYVYTQDRNYATINTYYTTSETNFTKWRTFNVNYGDLR